MTLVLTGPAPKPPKPEPVYQFLQQTDESNLCNSFDESHPLRLVRIDTVIAQPETADMPGTAHVVAIESSGNFIHVYCNLNAHSAKRIVKAANDSRAYGPGETLNHWAYYNLHIAHQIAARIKAIKAIGKNPIHAN